MYGVYASNTIIIVMAKIIKRVLASHFNVFDEKENKTKRKIIKIRNMLYIRRFGW